MSSNTPTNAGLVAADHLWQIGPWAQRFGVGCAGELLGSVSERQKRCPFCGGPGPFSSEHVLPEWTAKLLGLKKVYGTGQHHARGAIKMTAKESFGLKAGGVCKICNNEWMSDLENLTKPFLAPMILASPTTRVTLNSDEQVVLASWLWKILILHNLVAGGSYFTAEERACLKNGDSPPTVGVWMWLAKYSGQRLGRINGGPSNFASRQRQNFPAMVTTLVIGKFAAQAVAIRQGPRAIGHPVPEYDFTSAEVQLWPDCSDRIDWPPGGPWLNDADVNLWHKRWNEPTPG
jgi:hypothetical protein